MAIAEAKKGKDTSAYLKVVECLHNILPNDPMGIPDLGWVEQKNRLVKQETEKLEHELKAYKNNLIKESIRVSIHIHIILGGHIFPGQERAVTDGWTFCRWETKILASTTMPLAIFPTLSRLSFACVNIARLPNTLLT